MHDRLQFIIAVNAHRFNKRFRGAAGSAEFGRIVEEGAVAVNWRAARG